MAASHLDLKRRNEAFAKRAGKQQTKQNKSSNSDHLDKKKHIPAWAVWTLLFVVLGGVFFELLQQIFNAFTSPSKVTK
ncbi:hypothetical protein T439DRAFT_326939 [Meredithblackwellia eburnea MCA 4105]